MSAILQLPKWSLTDKHPAFYDLESATAIEQTAKVYGAMRELIDNYNNFVCEIEKIVSSFQLENNEDLETFKVGIRQEFQDFIDIINLKIKGLNNDIESAVKSMTENIDQTVNQYITENGVALSLEYDSTDESLTIQAT